MEHCHETINQNICTLFDVIVKLLHEELVKYGYYYFVAGSCEVTGWIKSARKQKERTFLNISDGSSHNHLQVVKCFREPTDLI